VLAGAGATAGSGFAAGACAGASGAGVAGASCATIIPVSQAKRHKTTTFFMGKAFLIKEVMFAGYCF
jgi:hypothetical protein